MKEALGARRTLTTESPRFIRETSRRISTLPQRDIQREFFLLNYNNLPSGIVERGLNEFASASKATQRKRLRDLGLPTPDTWSGRERPDCPSGTRFIVRPLRHSGGAGYRLTDDPTDWNPATEYIQKLFPKRHEYRIITVYGTPLITLYKRVPEDLARDQPWNHANGSSFVTVTNEENNRLRHTDVYERLKNNDIIKAAHLVGVDVLLGKREDGYAICEFNFCPSITIPENLEKVAAHVRQVHQAQR